jgi:spore maturation protein SpmA
MLNYIWLGLILLAVLLGGLEGRLKEVTDAAFESVKVSVMSIALPLVGITSLWLGIMRLAEKSGLVVVLARGLRPVMRRLFPEVPEDHPAMGSMLMNMAANMLGLANAATPLGLRAMTDLETLNPRPGTATNAMCTFLAINTASIQILPTTAIGLMAAAGSAQPTAIVATALFGSLCSTTVAITAVKLLQRLPWFRLPATETPTAPPQATNPPHAAGAAARPSTTAPSAPGPPGTAAAAGQSGGPTEKRPPADLPFWAGPVLTLFLLVFVAWFIQLILTGTTDPTPRPGAAEAVGLQSGPFLRVMQSVSLLAIPFFLSFFPLYAALHRVRVYEEFVEGAREGFQVAVRIIPFLVAMLGAVGMFRAAGGIDMFTQAAAPVLRALHFPPELVPLCLTRPLSGSASIGLVADLIKTLGPDHPVTRMGATILGSTETTFYVLAVYFGAVGVRRTRHAVAAGLLADLAGIVAAVAVCRLLFRLG